MLKKMEKAGWITRKRSEEDERMVMISITAEVEKLHDRAEAIPSKMAGCVALKHIPGVSTAFTASFYSGLGPMLLLSSVRFVSYQRLSI